MGVVICGWIEVRDQIGDEQFEWYGVVDVEPIAIMANPVIHSYLFGLRAKDKIGLFGKRDIPNDASERTKSSEIVRSNASWVSWLELKNVSWDQTIYDGKPHKSVNLGETYSLVGGAYQIIFDLMELLSKYHGEENVRLVAWFR